MNATPEVLRIKQAKEYLGIKDNRTLKKWCDDMNIPIVNRRILKALIDKKLSGKR